jgi:Domain of unknown function (DUF4261)
MHAFVLVDCAPTITAHGLREALTAWGVEASNEQTEEGVVSIDTRHGSLLVVQMPAPIPNGEADAAAKYSLSRFSSEAKWRPHTQHLLVTLRTKDKTVETVRAFTRAIAGIVQLVNAVGVYWGNGHVAHDADFFVSAADEDVPLMAWSGVSMAREGKDVSLVTTGLRQFELPELMVRAGGTQGNEALAYLFDLASYIVQRGEALPDGDTVGRTASEKMRVKYETSPFEPSQQIATVRLPTRMLS